MSIPVATRTIQDPDKSTFLTLWKATPPEQPHWGSDSKTVEIPSLGVQRLFEAITPNSTRDHKVWKNFEHFKAQSSSIPRNYSQGVTFTADCLDSNSWLNVGTLRNGGCLYKATDYGQYGRYNDGLQSWYVPRTDGGFIPPPDNLEDLKKRGLKAMLPSIKADMNALVSLYEAKDILSIRGSIKSATKLGKALFSKFGGLGSRPLGSAIARQAADGYLQWMFNLKPLISDIGGIYHAVATYQKRVNDMVSRSGKLQTAHFMCNLREQLIPTFSKGSERSGPLYKYNGTWAWTPATTRIERTVYPDSAVFRCSMQYNYTFSAFQVENQKILGLLDALGVNFNPRTIWQVIPWSFVVDWVIGIGQWLEQFEVKNMEPKVNILQYCWSVRKQRRIISVAAYKTAKFIGAPGTYAQQYLCMPVVTETSYRRGIDLPSGSSFTTSGLSSTELSLGAALIITRRRRNTKKRVTSS